MYNDKKVKDLRIKMQEMLDKYSEKFEENIDKEVAKKELGAFEGFKNVVENFDILRMYGLLEEDNDIDVKRLAKDMKKLIKELRADLKEASRSGKKSTFREMSEEMQDTLNDSPVIQRLPKEVRDNIMQSFTFNSSMKKDEYIRNVKAEIKQLEEERNAIIEAGLNPVKVDSFLYNDFIKQQKILQEELDYRDAQIEVTTTYNALCESYKTLEKCKQQLVEPDLSKKEIKKIENARGEALKNIAEYMDSGYSESLFDKDGKLVVTEEKLKSVLKEQIQDLAFEKNRLNGIVDDKVVQRDYYAIIKAGILGEIESAKDLLELQKKEKATEEHQKNPDVKEFTKRLRLKMLLEKLKQIYADEAKLKGLRERLEVLKNKPQNQLTPDEIKEMQRLSKKICNISMDVNRISSLINEIMQLGNELGISCIIDGNIDLNSVNQIDSVALPQVNQSIQNQRDEINARVYKVLDRYDISDDDLRLTTIRVKMNETVDDIRKNRRYRTIDLDYNNSKGAIMFNSNPGKTYYSNEPAKETSKKHEENDIDEKYEKDDTIAVIKKMNVDYTSLQLDTIDDRYKQRVECGRVYRYARGSGPYELLFISEDLDEYLDDPKKKLDEVLDRLRDRISNELSDGETLEDFCEENAENKYMKDLLSDNFMKRTIAKKKFIKDLAKANPGNEMLGYANMAIALNSEILPDDIDKTLSRLAQPYTRESDISKYVVTKEKSGTLGFIRKEEIKISHSKLVDTQEQKEQENEMHFEINTRSARDGMVRPFEIENVEMWDYKVSHDKNREKKKSKSKESEKEME